MNSRSAPNFPTPQHTTYKNTTVRRHYS